MEGKNLLDIGESIKNQIEWLNRNREQVIAIAMNKYTKDYLKKQNIYAIKIMNKNIPIIIDERLMNLELMFYREKMIEATEYVPYTKLGGITNE